MKCSIADALAIPPLQEPLTVTALRQQIRRKAPDSLLYRIAGGEAEFRRLASVYKLRATAPPSLAAIVQAAAPSKLPAPVAPIPTHRLTGQLSDRQTILLAIATARAEAGEAFPPMREIAELLCCSWIVVERDLRTLVRRGKLRISTVWHEGQGFRRIELVGRSLVTAPPAGFVKAPVAEARA